MPASGKELNYLSRQLAETQKLLSGLNEAQLQAVTHGEGPALILAGPGSGKTTVIVKRILYLIQIQKIPPEEILVVTFTKEAALSMQKRFQTLCIEMGQWQDPSTKESLLAMNETLPVNFGTFHSIFYHILLKSHYPAADKILSVAQKRDLMMAVLKEWTMQRNGHYEFETLKAQTGDYLAAVGFYKNTFDLEKAKCLLPADGREDFPQMLQTYQHKCKMEGGLDFDDMVYECRELLTGDEVLREYWQNRFRYILVDEFQDINPMQYEVLKLLGQKHNNVFVVGDEDQAIYGFRGADPDCVRRFAQEYRARQLLLNANYRSSSEIVALAEKVIAENKSRFLQNKGTYAAGPNAKIPKSIWFGSFETRQEELAYLVEQLKQLTLESASKSAIGNSAGNAVEILAGSTTGNTQKSTAKGKAGTTTEPTCGVLFRTNSAMQGLAVQLSKAGIPFVMKEKTNSPYEHFIFKDLCAYLKLAGGDYSREHFLRIMNRPLRYISRECAGEKSQINWSLLSGQTPNADREVQKLKEHIARMRGMPLMLAVQYICKAIGYETYLKLQKEAGEHLEEWLEKLEFYKEDAKSYQTVWEWEQAQRMYESRLKDSGKPENNSITLMTVHASKGLEFDRVYIPDCNEKIYPHGSMPDQNTLEEERRIFYVAMTRAKKHLELLCTTGSKERPRLVSRFLNPVIRQLSRQTHCCPNIRQMHQ